jgi:hypothetical protein
LNHVVLGIGCPVLPLSLSLSDRLLSRLCTLPFGIYGVDSSSIEFVEITPYYTRILFEEVTTAFLLDCVFGANNNYKPSGDTQAKRVDTN